MMLITYWWDFGDGKTSTVPNPTHVYAQDGSYTVTLTVTDTDGDSDTETKVEYITVTEPAPPNISNVQSSPGVDAKTTVVITWSTDKAVTSQVEYGPDETYGMTTPKDPTLVDNHTVVITGLEPGQTYHFRVISEDARGREAYSEDYTFTTQAGGG